MDRHDFLELSKESIAELSGALLDMRDALVLLSLTLQDLEFEFDINRRQIAVEVEKKLIENVRQFGGDESCLSRENERRQCPLMPMAHDGFEHKVDKPHWKITGSNRASTTAQ